MIVVLGVIGGFVIGSIPFGYLIGRWFYHVDIRRSGSGNIGAANALRTLGKRGALSVLVLDALKGFAPVFLLLTLTHDATAAACAGAAAVLGHCFSPWLNWHGGKGVATSLGVIFALSWQAGLACVAAWVVGGFATGYSSVGSMLANLAAPFALWFFLRDAAASAYGVFAALLIIYTHRENVERLRTGRENVLGLLRPWRRRDEVQG